MSTFNKRIPHLLQSDPDWPARRAACLSQEPLCRSCAALGYVAVATTVDHIIPRARGGTSDEDNLQPLCNDCHNAKSGREKHGGVDDRRQVALDGGPMGRRIEIKPQSFGKSPRARFLNRSYREEK